MERADHLRVCVKKYGITTPIYHHGIDMGDGTVIHFRKAHLGDTPIISRTSIEDFAHGGKVEVVRYAYSFSDDDVVEFAEILLMNQDYMKFKYDFLHDNCEHIAIFCKTGHLESKQVNNVQKVFDLSVLAAVLGLTL